MIAQRFLAWARTAPVEQRAEAAHALARAYLYSEVSGDERDGMEAAMTLLLDDPSPEVRFALADALANNLDAPKHIILSLVADQPETAALVLSRSPVVLDTELVDIVAAAEEALQAAVARRPAVSAAVSAAISEVGEREACFALVSNPGAAIARISLMRVADRFGEDVEIREAMLERPDLPVDVHQYLVRRLGDALGALVAARAWVDEDRLDGVTRDACDRATIAIAAETAFDELPALIEHLRVTGQLTTSLLLRAVCAGNLAFFEAALSILSGMPEDRVIGLVRGGRRSALKAIYGKARLPAVAFDAFDVAVDICKSCPPPREPGERLRFARWIVDRVIERYEGITDGEMSELMAMLRRFAAEAARYAARDYAESVKAA
jgi:uncharacterized protein (DUF2336 family)